MMVQWGRQRQRRLQRARTRRQERNEGVLTTSHVARGLVGWVVMGFGCKCSCSVLRADGDRTGEEEKRKPTIKAGGRE
jgi:hypothetical protein